MFLHCEACLTSPKKVLPGDGVMMKRSPGSCKLALLQVTCSAPVGRIFFHTSLHLIHLSETIEHCIKLFSCIIVYCIAQMSVTSLMEIVLLPRLT